MTSAAKLGTRVVVGATVAAALALATATVASRASGAARVTALTSAGAPGFKGDGKPAANATLSAPAGVATDAAGNVVIADTDNCRVRYVPAVSVKRFGITMRAHDIYTIGGSTCGAAGNQVPATRAQLSFPSDVALDSAGDVFVADTGNNEIRKISSSAGEISTVAGNGTPGGSGINGKATDAELDGPTGLAVDRRGNVLIADTNNCRVVETTADGTIRIVAGTGTCGDTGDRHSATHAELLNPTDIAVDAHGNVVIADTGNRLVREVAAVPGTNFGIIMSPGCIYTVAGSGTYQPYFGDGAPAASEASSLSYPTGIALDSAGDLFVADTYGRAVREIPLASGVAFGISTQADDIYAIAGAGPAQSPTAGGTAADPLVYPSRVAVDAAGDVFVADIGNNSIERLAH